MQDILRKSQVFKDNSIKRFDFPCFMCYNTCQQSTERAMLHNQQGENLIMPIIIRFENVHRLSDANTSQEALINLAREELNANIVEEIPATNQTFIENLRHNQRRYGELWCDYEWSEEELSRNRRNLRPNRDIINEWAREFEADLASLTSDWIFSVEFRRTVRNINPDLLPDFKPTAPELVPLVTKAAYAHMELSIGSESMAEILSEIHGDEITLGVVAGWGTKREEYYKVKEFMGDYHCWYSHENKPPTEARIAYYCQYLMAKSTTDYIRSLGYRGDEINVWKQEALSGFTNWVITGI